MALVDSKAKPAVQGTVSADVGQHALPGDGMYWVQGRYGAALWESVLETFDYNEACRFASLLIERGEYPHTRVVQHKVWASFDAGVRADG